MALDDMDDTATRRSVPEAVAEWSRRTFGAPRNLLSLSCGPVEVRDETIERVATHVVRRTLVEITEPERAAGPSHPRLKLASIDPFKYTTAELRAETEYVRQCCMCSGSTQMPCETCGASGKMACPTCRGSGKELKHYKTAASKYINCKDCRSKGLVRCVPCGGDGNVACKPCHGLGHERVWLSFEQTERVIVSVYPDSPVLIAHPILCAARELEESELRDFVVVRNATCTGPLESSAIPEDVENLAAGQLKQLDPRTEIVDRQQYLNLKVIRRDVVYQMAGITGTLVLSGRNLSTSSTPGALRPIRRRLIAWGMTIGIVLALTLLMRAATVGSTSYFEGARRISAALAVAAVIFAVPAMGGLWRSWRGGLRFWRLGIVSTVTLFAMVASVAAVPVVGKLSRPTVAEAKSAIASGNLSRGRVVVDALHSLGDEHQATFAVEDELLLAEADVASGADRPALLAAIVARQGPASGAAARAAREDRLVVIRNLIAQNNSVDSLIALDRWFPADVSDDPEIALERARAHDTAYTACSTDVCRLVESSRAQAASEDPERTTRVATLRASVHAALTPPAEYDATLPSLSRAAAFARLATEVADKIPGDVELVDRAAVASRWAKSVRSQVPLLRNNLEIVQELLGGTFTQLTPELAKFDLDGVSMFAVFDHAKRCSGLYAIGGGALHVYNSTQWPPDRLLSQAFGKPAHLQLPDVSTPAVSSWREGSTPVVARWVDGQLVELRIADAAP